MWTAFGVSLWSMVLLTIPNLAFAQNIPGYRMRFPIGGQVGTSVRPPRLTVAAEGSPERQGGPFRRQFALAYENFGWYFVGPEDYAYLDDSTAGAYSRVTEPPRAEPVYYSVADVGRLEVSSRRLGSRIVVRLALPDGSGAAQVAFFLADATKTIVSAQTDRSPPFTAVFEPAPGTAFAGMTVVLPNGTLVTQYAPYARPAR